MNLGRYKRELSAALAYVLLLAVVGVAAPTFFGAGNLRDLALNNAPVLLVAVGMTLVILVGEIDISVGSQFAVCSVAAGWLAKEGVPVALLLPSRSLTRRADGRGERRAGRLPASAFDHRDAGDARRVARRAALGDRGRVGAGPARRTSSGSGWVRAWRSGSSSAARWACLAAFSWMLRNLGAGRAVYAVGSDAEAARLAGIEPRRVVFGVFVLMGALTGWRRS